jgi:hypothetical protein
MLIVRRSHNICRNILFNQAMNLSFHKNANLLRIILNSFVCKANTERNITQYITRKFHGKCYIKYRVHRCSGNIGITTCTTSKVTKIYPYFSGSLRSLSKMEHELFPTDYLKLLFMNRHCF